MHAHRSPHRAGKHLQAGLGHAQARRWPAAAQAFERATAQDPLNALVWLNLARAQKHSDQPDAAIASATRAFALDPASTVACRMLADGLTRQHRHAEAAACFDRLAPEAPRSHELLSEQGIALFSARRLREAIAAFFQALALKLDAPLVHYRLGLAFMDLTMKEEASECFRTAVALDEGGIRAMSLALLVHESAQACRWGELEADTRALRDTVMAIDAEQGGLLSPFPFVAIECTPLEQRHVGALRARALARGVARLPAPSTQRAPGRIRLGYLSSDFHHHVTSLLLAEQLEHRNQADFEVFLYSHSPLDDTPLQRRVMAACDHFIDVRALGNGAIAERIRADGIDILVDLKGHTRDSRFEVLAARAAPVQASYLGYPGTSGADFIDYVIGDPVVTPLAHAAHFSEQIAQMPWSYQPNDRQREIPESPGREACGLPADAVVLCCFNQTYKILPATADAWARILARSPNAVLWLLVWNPQAQRNLQLEMTRRGVDPSRLIFAPKLGTRQHAARLQCADLFLDTWPCNAHTTASESLWAGVPVLTLPGETFASRVAASLARATGTDGLVCTSVDDYVERAVALANDLPALRAVQAHLRDQRMALPLFDSAASAQALEGLFRRMHARSLAGLSPEHLPALA